MAELGTEGSIDGNQRLVIRGKYVPKYIESLLRKYIVEYVTCKMCRSANTTLTKVRGSAPPAPPYCLWCWGVIL